MRVITVKDYWTYWLRVFKKLEGKSISIPKLLENIFGEYDIRLKIHLVRVFSALKNRDLVRGEILYKFNGKRSVPFLYIDKVVNFKVLERGEDKIKILAYYDEETLKNYLD